MHDADAVVHRLYEGEAAAAIEAAFPGTTAGGKVDRERLAAAVLRCSRRIEKAGGDRSSAGACRRMPASRASRSPRGESRRPRYPASVRDRRRPARGCRRRGSAPVEVQQSRVLARPGMTREKLEAVLRRQMPDAEKRRRADFVVDTSQGLDAARAQVRAILDAVATMPRRRK